MLFVYLYFLDLFAESVVVVFVRSSTPTVPLKNIHRRSVIGVVSSKYVLRTLREEFPFLNADWGNPNIPPFRPNSSDLPDENMLENLLVHMHPNFSNESGNRFLTAVLVQTWFRDQLNSRVINAQITQEDLREVRSALVKEEKYLLVFDSGGLTSVLSICQLTNRISLRALSTIDPSQLTRSGKADK